MNTSTARRTRLEPSTPPPLAQSSAQRARARWLTSSPERVNAVVATLFSRYRRPVQARLEQLGLNRADAEELCAEVFVVAMRRLPEYEGTSTLSTWLFGIARKVASDHRRSARARCETLVDELPESETFESPEQAVEAKLRAQLVRTGVDALKPKQRAVVLEFSLRERPMEEVARGQRVPLHTAYARLYAGHAALKQLGAEPFFES
ncbi:MAG: sigma-70 family RNA polymerase sigma factor [Archangiaceae bacterium]|nr:sigma-70 family RNA polymerase sigma factor [Archangiaceae bacterium]